MVARTTLVETEEQLVLRFIGGLGYQIQIALQQFNPLTVSEANQHALAMEIQYRSSWSTRNNRGRSTSQVANNTTSSTSEASQQRPTAARTDTNTTTYAITQSRPT